MCPEIWNARDRIFCHYGPFFALLQGVRKSMDLENHNFEKMKNTLKAIIILQMFTINDSHTIYGFSDMEYNRQICHFGPFFALLPPPNNPKNQNLKN